MEADPCFIAEAVLKLGFWTLGLQIFSIMSGSSSMVFIAHNIVPETKQVIKKTGFILAWFWPKVKG